MSNYGMDMGSGNSYNGETKITNKTSIKKGHIVISLTVVIVIALIAILVINSGSNIKRDILGKWVTEKGETIEFLSDGSIHRDGYDDLNADTYEIMDEGYLKWGEYSAAWIEYKYTYWDVKISGNEMTLTERDNKDNIKKFTKE